MGTVTNPNTFLGFNIGGQAPFASNRPPIVRPFSLSTPTLDLTSTFGPNGIGVNLAGESADFGSLLRPIASELRSDIATLRELENPFIQARVRPLEERRDEFISQLNQDLGRRNVTGTLATNERLRAEREFGRQITDQRALATADSQAAILDRLNALQSNASAQVGAELAALGVSKDVADSIAGQIVTETFDKLTVPQDLDALASFTGQIAPLLEGILGAGAPQTNIDIETVVRDVLGDIQAQGGAGGAGGQGGTGGEATATGGIATAEGGNVGNVEGGSSQSTTGPINIENILDRLIGDIFAQGGQGGNVGDISVPTTDRFDFSFDFPFPDGPGPEPTPGDTGGSPVPIPNEGGDNGADDQPIIIPDITVPTRDRTDVAAGFANVAARGIFGAGEGLLGSLGAAAAPAIPAIMRALGFGPAAEKDKFLEGLAIQGTADLVNAARQGTPETINGIPGFRIGNQFLPDPNGSISQALNTGDTSLIPGSAAFVQQGGFDLALLDIDENGNLVDKSIPGTGRTRLGDIQSTIAARQAPPPIAPAPSIGTSFDRFGNQLDQFGNPIFRAGNDR